MLSQILALLFSRGPLYPKLLALIQWAGSGGAWSPFGIPADIKGVRVDGNARAPRTQWWNHWFLARGGGWDRWVVLSVVATDGKSYLMGYRPTNKHRSMVCTASIATTCVAFKVGCEDVTFFAIDSKTREEVSLKVVVSPRGKTLYRKHELPRTGITLL